MGIEILYILIFKGSLINHILQIPVFFPLDLIVAKWNVFFLFNRFLFSFFKCLLGYPPKNQAVKKRKLSNVKEFA